MTHRLREWVLFSRGLRDSGRSKPGTPGFWSMWNRRFAAARAMPPPLKSIRGSARPEMGYPNTEEQMRHSSDEFNQVRRERKLWKRQDCTFCPFRY